MRTRQYVYNEQIAGCLPSHSIVARNGPPSGFLFPGVPGWHSAGCPASGVHQTRQIRSYGYQVLGHAHATTLATETVAQTCCLACGLDLASDMLHRELENPL